MQDISIIEISDTKMIESDKVVQLLWHFFMTGGSRAPRDDIPRLASAFIDNIGRIVKKYDCGQ
jgi:hypothetical protein